MASGKSIGILLVGIILLAVGAFFVLNFVNMGQDLQTYQLSVQSCFGDAGCIALTQQSWLTKYWLGDLELLSSIYMYGGFGIIVGGAICLILAIMKLLKGT